MHGFAPQKCAEVGARRFVGVNYCAMGKYLQPATPEQWQHCVTSLKVLLNHLSICITPGANLTSVTGYLGADGSTASHA